MGSKDYDRNLNLTGKQRIDAYDDAKAVAYSLMNGRIASKIMTVH